MTMLGLIENLPNEDYHASEGVSSSKLKVLLNKSPLHAVTPDEKEQTRAMEIGTAIHAAILEPERFDSEYRIVECDTRTSALYKAACREHPSYLVLTDKEAENVIGMQRSAYSNSAFRAHLEASAKRELSVFAKCPETGLLLRCRWDIEPFNGIGFDLKKTQDCSSDKLERAIYNYGYHISAAFYMYVWSLASGEHLSEFRLGWIEEKKPHASRVTRIPEDALEIGMQEVRAGLRIYADCLESGEFFAYGDGVDDVGIPAWAYSKADEVSLDGLEEI